MYEYLDLTEVDFIIWFIIERSMSNENITQKPAVYTLHLQNFPQNFYNMR